MSKLIKCLEVHTYAPELNKLHLRGGAVLAAPGVGGVQYARETMFKPVKPGRYARFEFKHPDKSQLNATMHGRASGYKTILLLWHDFITRHNAPGGEYTIKTGLVG